MFILKGILLGGLMFFVFSLVYLWANGMIGTTGAVTVEVTRAILTRNPLYWTAVVLMLVLGCVIVAMWPVKVTP